MSTLEYLTTMRRGYRLYDAQTWCYVDQLFCDAGEAGEFVAGLPVQLRDRLAVHPVDYLTLDAYGPASCE